MTILLKKTLASMLSLGWRILRVIDSVCEWTGRIVSFLMTVVIGVMIYNVIQRAVFGKPSLGYVGMNSRYFLIYIVLGVGYVFRRNAFVNIDILPSHLSTRVRAWGELLTSSLFFVFTLTLLRATGQVALATKIPRNPVSTGLLLAPSWAVNLLLPFGVFLLLLQGLAKFVRDLVLATAGRKIE